ncbi:MAG: AAA family ATPase [Myxococcota bacterium]|nr:AAA family ATPase [Myxococcota bacterium]
MDSSPFPVIRVAHVQPRPPADRWLVEGLWGWPAVGFVAGCPKSLKTWMALELAVSVASGQPCLGRYPVKKRGHVLLYAAEDSAQAIRERVAGIAASRHVDLETLGVGLITVPSLRLDNEEHRRRLHATLAAIRPRLLVLDPLVRLHGGDENSSADISSLLDFLRGLQREYEVAILVVHHVRKAPAAVAGQALRGSGDLHAWLDSALYLMRSNGRLVLRPEHRDNACIEPIEIELDPGRPHLVVRGPALVDVQASATSTGDLEARLLEALAQEPRTRASLREHLKVRNETLGKALSGLQERGVVAQADGFWARVA